MVEGWTPEDIAIYHDNTLVIKYLRRETTVEKLLNSSEYPFWTLCKSCFKMRIHSWVKEHLLRLLPLSLSISFCADED